MGDSVLFLDVDGVLNCRATWLRNDGQRGTLRLCPDRIALLARMLSKTNAMIVLSSTWREFGNHVEYLRGRAPSVTCRLHADWRTKRFERSAFSRLDGERGTEIKEWLSRHPEVTCYAIVDDDSDMLAEQLPFFVQTDFDNGLMQRHAERLLWILAGSEHD